MTPKISILLPNLNNRPYLDERLKTIMEQTFSDWELIIVDNYSDDGAWEFFQEWAKKDTRVKISQAPRAGMYANWNNCIRLAKGEYVYIATSDDSMTPNALEEMVKALEEHPECDLAHCKLKIIDENGAPHHTLNWDKFYCALYFGDLIDQKHIRLAPHDGVLHCGVKTVYTSITQLLIRRSLFDRVGLFLTNFGSIADFEWGMRASLLANTVHIPQYLATWRVHRDQGTNIEFLNTSEYRTKLLEMMEHAFTAAKKINPTLLSGIKIKKLKHLYLKEKLKFEIKEQVQEQPTAAKIYKYKIGVKWLLTNPGVLLEYFRSAKSKVLKKAFVSPPEALEFGRKILSQYGLEKNVIIIK
ncbi:MAG: hypothetical protein QG657_3157 [Acidobacteriota bacterium]|nr:hypothetical protein [Acidobacteriota bacterium]